MEREHRDDLFTPTISAAPLPTEPPYRNGSLVYPAFFGGPLAMLPFARRTATRLGLPDRDVLRITLLCLAGLAVGLVAAVLLDANGASGRRLRLSLQVAGLLTYAVVARVLRGPERRHELRGGTFQKLGFWLGLGACVALGLVQGLLLAAVLGAVG